MKVILILFIFFIQLHPSAYSHGSKGDCSIECNDYYCPPEMNIDKESKFSSNK